MDPIDVVCPACAAMIAEECEGGVTHQAREEEAERTGFGGSLGVLDWDGDGVPAALDFDDPAGWF